MEPRVRLFRIWNLVAVLVHLVPFIMTLHRAPDQSEIVCRDLILLQHRKNGLERAAERSCKIFRAENRAVESLHQVHELLHLLGLTLGIVGVALLDLEHLGLQHLHTGRRLGRLEHERRQQQTDDDHQDNDGQAPVDRKGLDELEQLEKDVNDPIPHVIFPPIASAR